MSSWMVTTQSLSVIVPVYNSEATLQELVTRTESVLASITDDAEIILVNDGSQDSSWAKICELSTKSSSVRGLNLMRNYGQHNALLTGIRAAQYETSVTMDDDLQHPPEEIPRLLSKLAEGFDVVYGVPAQEQHGLWRDIASQVTKLVLQNSMGVEIARDTSAFRVFRTQVRDAFLAYDSAFVDIDALLTWGTTRFGALKVQHDPRRIGSSNYTVGSLVIHAVDMLTSFSTVPLRISSITGFIFTAFGFVVLVYVVGRYLIEGGDVPGFAFLASITAIFAGAQLFAVGVIGEYLARMHYQSMGRPSGVVRDTTDDDINTGRLQMQDGRRSEKDFAVGIIDEKTHRPNA